MGRSCCLVANSRKQAEEALSGTRTSVALRDGWPSEMVEVANPRTTDSAMLFPTANCPAKRVEVIPQVRLASASDRPQVNLVRSLRRPCTGPHLLADCCTRCIPVANCLARRGRGHPSRVCGDAWRGNVGTFWCAYLAFSNSRRRIFRIQGPLSQRLI